MSIETITANIVSLYLLVFIQFAVLATLYHYKNKQIDESMKHITAWMQLQETINNNIAKEFINIENNKKEN